MTRMRGTATTIDPLDERGQRNEVIVARQLLSLRPVSGVWVHSIRGCFTARIAALLLLSPTIRWRVVS